MSVVSVVVLVFLLAVIMVVGALMTAMFVKDKPFYGAVGLFVLSGPGSILAFVYLAASGG